MNKLSKEEIKSINDAIFKNPILKYLTNVIPTDTLIKRFGYLNINNLSKDVDAGDNSETTTCELPMYVESQTVQVETCQVSADITNDMKNLLQDHGIDVNLITKTSIINEVKLNLVKSIIDDIQKYGEVAYRKTWTKYENMKERVTKWIHLNLPILEKILPFIFKGIYKKEYLLNLNTSDTEIISQLDKYISKHASILATKTGNGYEDVIITNQAISRLLEKSPYFKYFKINSLNNLPFYAVGKYKGITVIINSFMPYNENRITIFKKPLYKEGDILEPGLLLLYLENGTAFDEYTQTPHGKKLNLQIRYTNTFLGDSSIADRYFETIYFKIKETKNGRN